ncbi:hypothetical protein, partial [Mycolicibacter senuensis]|uniref:hypothetical protein n=1 Tax=Mycolicibacter senuensis TaxID=386913 RepID=UPI001057A3C5
MSSKLVRSSGRGSVRRRVVGASSSVAAFLAFGVAPVVAAPSAQADDFGLDAFWDFFGVGDGGVASDFELFDVSTWGVPGVAEGGLFGLWDADHAELWQETFYLPLH